MGKNFDRSKLQHQLLGQYKELAQQLDRTPTRDELCQHTNITRHQIERAFGIFAELKKAAGLNLRRVKEETKPDVSLRVQKWLRAYQEHSERSVINMDLSPTSGPFPTIVCIGDLHCPYWDEAGVSLAYAMIEAIKPDYVIQMGDAYDMYAFSRFPTPKLNRKYNILSPEDEIQTARKQLESFWITVQSLSPRSKCVQLLGNHDVRPHKKILMSDIGECELFFNFFHLFEFDGVHTHKSTRDPYIISDIAFTHGFLSGKGQHRRKFLTHVVHGHTHRGGVTVDKIDGKMLFELDCGFLGNVDSTPMSYTAVKEVRWTKGIGIITPFGPNFIPFE